MTRKWLWLGGTALITALGCGSDGGGSHRGDPPGEGAGGGAGGAEGADGNAAGETDQGTAGETQSPGSGGQAGTGGANDTDDEPFAPALDRSIASNLALASAFLYTGKDAPQQGVREGTIDELRVAVVRGRVEDKQGEALAGVRVSVVQHPEYGHTLTRADGMFDLALNGGSAVTLRFDLEEHLSAQRTLRTKPLRYAWAPDVVLIQPDQQTSEISVGASTAQVGRGSLVSDASGDRQATLAFRPGTAAVAIGADGSETELTTLTLRATEVTVGDVGPKTMAATLPSSSAYTYAVELTVDEATKLGASSVRFDKPVAFYVENFLGFPVGGEVPLGYYDPQVGRWDASTSGVVLKVLDVDAGRALLDTDGDGVADDEGTLSDLGIEEPELEQLAKLYEPGQTLWRVELDHFSLWDCNWPFGPPLDAVANALSFEGLFDPDKPCRASGSIIDCESQVLGESFGVVGTPLYLVYGSDRSTARKAAYELDIPVTGPTPPGSLKAVEVEVLVAGQRYSKRLEPTPSQVHHFAWDGRDGYGRLLQGSQPAQIRVGYVYEGVYNEGRSFGRPSDVPITGSRTRQEVALWREEEVLLGGWDALGQGLGGLSLSLHHAYDPIGQVLYLGDGTKRSARAISNTMRRLSTEDLGSIPSLAFAPDGTLYVVSDSGRHLRRVTKDGSTEVIAGNGTLGFSPDGTPALDAQVSLDLGLAVQRDGSVIFEDRARVRTIAPDGTLRTLAGGGERPAGYADARFGLPAQQAFFDYANGLAVADDGSIFINDAILGLWRLDPSGVIWMVASQYDFYAGQAGAVHSDIGLNSGLALAADGSLYMALTTPASLVRFSPSGALETLADESDGLYNPKQIALAPDGSVLIANFYGADLLRYVPGQGVRRVAGGGTGNYPPRTVAPLPALDTRLAGPEAVAVSPQGDVYLGANGSIFKLSPALPGLSLTDSVLPSDDGSELYVFNGAGRHLSTYDAITGVKLLSFEYDDRWLSTITDRFGVETTLERGSDHQLVAITAPDGQRSDVTLDDAGRLTQLVDPLARSVTLGYDDAGLLGKLTDARGGAHQFTYDNSGRLVSDKGPAGFEQTLARSTSETGYTVTRSTPLGRATDYVVGSDSGDVRERRVIGPDGLSSRVQVSSAQRVMDEPDGTRIELTLSADPRFDLQVPRLASATKATPGGRQLVTTGSQSVTLESEEDLLSVSTSLQTLSIAGRKFQSSYDRATGTITQTSPEGRATKTFLNDQGQVTRRLAPGRAPVSFEYDARGRISTSTVGEGAGARTTSYTYDANGWLAHVTDALGNMTTLTSDAAGRPLTLNGTVAGTLTLAYDAHDNLVSLTPPGRDSYGFAFDAADLPTSSSEPELTGSLGWSFDHTADQQLSSQKRPDGSTLGYGYDDAGRLVEVEATAGSYTFAYTATGQLASVRTPSGESTSLVYDGPLLLTASSSGSVTGTLGYAYDAAWQVSSTTVNTEAPIALGYDDDGLLLSAGPISIARDAASGAAKSLSVGKVTSSFAYDSFGARASLAASFEGTALLSQSYERDALGRVTTLSETIAGETTDTAYGYDAAGRLVSVERGGAAVAFDYDDNGNRLGVDVDGTVTSGAYDAHDRIVSFGSRGYEHDGLGNLVLLQDGAATTRYAYDDFGALVQVTLPSGNVVDYVIDGAGRRIARKVDGVLTAAYLYDGALQPRAQLDASGAVVAEFVYTGSENAPDAIKRGSSTYALVRDQLGSVRLVVDVATGAIAQRVDYDAFGAVTLDTNPGFQPFGFAGGLYDAATGIVHFGAREYDASIGRWITKDPLRFEGGQTNLYVYVGNDPVDFSDPTGKFANLAWGFAIGAGTDAVFQLARGGCFQWGEFWIAGGYGALTGGLSATGSWGTNALIGGAGSVAQYVTTQSYYDRPVTMQGAWAAGLLGGLGGAAGTWWSTGSRTSGAIFVQGSAIKGAVGRDLARTLNLNTTSATTAFLQDLAANIGGNIIGNLPGSPD